MNKDILNRILAFMKVVGVNRSQLAEMLGMHKGTLISQMNGSRGLPLDVLSQIFDKFPMLNKEWVFSGEGLMTLDPSEDETTDNAYLAKIRVLQRENKELIIRIREKDAQIEVLKSLITDKK